MQLSREQKEGKKKENLLLEAFSQFVWLNVGR